jgi:hypothetical protein
MSAQPVTPDQTPTGIFPRAALSAAVGEAAAAAAQLHLNHLHNGLLRLARTTHANNSPAEVGVIAEHCLENLQAFLSSLQGSSK